MDSVDLLGWVDGRRKCAEASAGIYGETDRLQELFHIGNAARLELIDFATDISGKKFMTQSTHLINFIAFKAVRSNERRPDHARATDQSASLCIHPRRRIAFITE